MKIKYAKALRSIAKIALLLCFLSLLGLGIFFTYRSLKYKPYKVRVSNVTDSAFTVSWVTEEPMVGVVYYGDKDSFLPGPLTGIGKSKAVDDRDVSNAQTDCVSEFNKEASKNKDDNFTIDIEGYDCNSVKVTKRGSYYTHHVTVQNLEAEKEYYFRVGDGYISYAKGKTDGVEYIEREMPAVEVFSQKTLPVINEVSSPNPAYGTSYNLFYSNDGQVGMKKNFDAIIFLKTFKEGIQYPLMSAVSNVDGGWSIDYANVRDSEGKTLGMENTYVEFIPQVENTRPGASGTNRFEDTEYPLNLMGNNMDDLKKGLEEQEENEELGSILKKLTNRVIADEYDDAIFCYPNNGCTGKTFTKVNGGCPSGYQTTKPASCSSSNPPTGTPPTVQYKNCCSKGSESCYCIRDTKCSSGQVEYSGTLAQAKAACEASIVTEPEKKVTCCAKFAADCNCVSNKQPGTCPAGYVQYDTNNLESARTQCKASLPEVSKTCCKVTTSGSKNTCDCRYNYKDCSEIGSGFVEYKDADTCKNELPKTCCTYDATKNTCSCGKACTVANLSQESCNKKVEDRKLKTCCKQTVNSSNKVSCNCLEKQTSCSGEYKEFKDKNSCEDGTVVQGECGSDGKGSSFILNLDFSDFINTVPRPTSSSLFDRFISRSYADDSNSGYTYYFPSFTMMNNNSSTSPCNQEASEETSVATEKETCSDYFTCKNCWSVKDCTLIRKQTGESCPDGYVDNDKDNNVCPGASGATLENPNSSIVTNCTTSSGSGSGSSIPTAKNGKTLRIVSGGCGENNCYAQYKNSDGSTCGSLKLNNVACENRYCEDQQKKSLKKESEKDCSDIVCDSSAGCLCPDECSNFVAPKGYSCGAQEIPVEDAEESSTEKIVKETVNIVCDGTTPAAMFICKIIGKENLSNELTEAIKAVKGLAGNIAKDYTNTGSECSGLPADKEEACLQEWIEKQYFPISEEDDTQGNKLITCWKPNADNKSCGQKREKQETCDANKQEFIIEDACKKTLKANYSPQCYNSTSNCHVSEKKKLENECVGDKYFWDDPTCGGTAGCYAFDSLESPCVQRSCFAPSFSYSLYHTIWDCEVDRHEKILKDELKTTKFVNIESGNTSWPSYVCCPYNEEGDEIETFLTKSSCINQIEKVGTLSMEEFPAIEECTPFEGWEIKNQNSPLTFKSHAQNNEEGNNSIFYLPEEGVYSVKTSLSSQPLKVVGGTKGGYLLYEDRNGIEGYQSPEDPQNPQENEDIILNLSGLEMEISQETSSTDLTLKRGINIISFNSLPSLGESQPMTSHDFLEIANSDGDKVSRISYFSGGQWNGGTSYDFDKEEVKGVSFDLIFGKGYLVVAESDATISIPSYSISKPIPIAFSSGWNLVGVHGYSTQYTANSLINSINTIEGLKSNNVTYWPTSKGMYQGYQLSEGQAYGQDFPISKDLGYFVRISEFNAPDDSCKSIIWNPGGDLNGKCGSNN